MKIPHNIFEIIGGQWLIEQHIAFSYIDKLIELPLSLFELEEIGKYDIIISDGSQNLKLQDLSDTELSFDNAPKGSVAIFPFKGVFLKYSTSYNHGAVDIANAIIQAANHKNISSIVFDMDSGGGAANAIPCLMDALNFAKTKKPIVTLADRCGSAAYWVASATDFIMAENDITSSFGSIGVMTSMNDLSKLFEKHGIVQRNIYAPESEHKNQAAENAIKGDDSLLKTEILSPLAKKFQNHVRQSRAGKLNEKETGVLSGKMFFADAALNNGLIDSIGNMQMAIEKALQLSDIKNFMNS